MAIGLTSEQLLNNFCTNCIKRLNEARGILDASKAGENPEVAKTLHVLQEQDPSMNIEQTAMLLSIGIAFMDCIVQNNEALTKVIPHLEV